MNIQEVKKCFQKGFPVLLFDPERENEVDLVVPNQSIENSTLLFMLQLGKGLLCTALDEHQLLKKGFFKLPSSNTDPFCTNFFVPIDYHSVHTGISTLERVCTLKEVANNRSISDFTYPGHINLLGGKGLENRKGHTEASIELCELAGYSRAATIIEVLDSQGKSHNIQYAISVATKHKLPFCSIQKVYAAMIQKKVLLSKISEASLPTEFGDFKIIGFSTLLDHVEHFAITKGDITQGKVLVRIHSECATGDIFHSRKCDCRDQLVNSLSEIEKAGKGVLIYLRQEGRGIGIANKIKTYALQEKGLDTFDANLAIGRKADERDYASAAQILKILDVSEIVLLTNNPQKIAGLQQYGISINHTKPVTGKITSFNQTYLLAKIKRFHHTIPLKEN